MSQYDLALQEDKQIQIGVLFIETIEFNSLISSRYFTNR